MYKFSLSLYKLSLSLYGFSLSLCKLRLSLEFLPWRRLILRLLQRGYAFSPSISFCSESRKWAAWAPSICVWWNWNDRRSVVLNQLRLYFPQMMKGLLKMPLYIPTAPSISYRASADVPMTMLSGRSWLVQLCATCCVSWR